jgi:hypothetical protein
MRPIRPVPEDTHKVTQSVNLAVDVTDDIQGAGKERLNQAADWYIGV